MPAVFYADSKQFTADRIFTAKDQPSIAEIYGEFHYQGGGPVTSEGHLDILPEPHRTRAKKWFKTQQPQAAEAPSTSNLDTNEGGELCGVCGSGPFKREQDFKAHKTKFHSEG